MQKLLIQQLFLPAFHSYNKLQPQPTSRSILTSWTRDSAPLVVQSLSLSVSDPLWPHGLQDSRLPCPSLLIRVCSNSCPLSRWCHPTISSSAVPFSSCLQTFPALGSFAVSQLFPSVGQSNGASVSALVLPVGAYIIQDPNEIPEAFTFFPPNIAQIVKSTWQVICCQDTAMWFVGCQPTF